MKNSKINVEPILFLLAFILALSVRFYRLGATPLSDFEARWALQALDISLGKEAQPEPAPGYLSLTASAFFLFGSEDALARFWPAVAGSILILVPYLFRQSLGGQAALIMAFGLAIDPGLAALSRLAGGPMMAIGFGSAALGFVYSRRWFAAGIFLGLALLGGPEVLLGALILFFTWGLGKIMDQRGWLGAHEDEETKPGAVTNIRTIALVCGGSILTVAGIFLSYPRGLASVTGMLPTFLEGWVNSSGTPVLRIFVAPLLYQPVAVLFGLVTAGRAWLQIHIISWLEPHDPDAEMEVQQRSDISRALVRKLGLFVFVSLVVILIYPNHQVSDIPWILVPLWALAALELSQQMYIRERDRLPALGQASLVILLFALAWVNLAGLSWATPGTREYQLRWAVIAGTVALGFITTILVALGWSSTVAKRGLSWGLCSALGLYVIASLWDVTQLQPNGVQELWAPAPATQQDDLLQRTLGDLAEWRTGRRDTLDLLLVEPSPSLEWALRNWKNVRIVSSLPAREMPEGVITTGDQVEPDLAAAYRGQDFGWQVYPAWEGTIPPDWKRWLVFRSAPQREEQVILWARADLFPADTSPPVEQLPLPAGEEEEFVPGGENVP